MSGRARLIIVIIAVLAPLGMPWAYEERQTAPENPAPVPQSRPNQLLSILPTFGPFRMRHACPDAWGNYDPANCSSKGAP